MSALTADLDPAALDGMSVRERDGVAWLEAALPGARAAFSLRNGGVSDPPFDSLNLGYLTGDEPARVASNRRRLSAALELELEQIVIGRQVHGAAIAAHDAPQRPSPFAEPGSVDPPEVDAHTTAAYGLALLVFVADCLPIAVAGERGVAMIHGGWRPLAAGIVEPAVAAVGGTAAAIGPGIGPCCFEVGEEVPAAFDALGGGIADGRMLDLPEVATRLLRAAGVDDVRVARVCTRCNPGLLFSHRGGGPDTGRQGGLVIRTTEGRSA